MVRSAVPAKGEPFWKKFGIPIMVLAFVLPVIDTHRFFLAQTEIVYDAESETYSFEEPMPLKESFKFLIPTMIWLSVYSIGINLGSRMTLRTLNPHVRSKASNNFIVITLITSCTQAFGCAISIVRVTWPTGQIAKLLAEILPFVSDGLTLMQPLLLVALASSIRVKVFAFFKKKNTSAVHVITSRHSEI